MARKIDRANAAFDKIIGERRSHRKFTEKVPPDEMIESIIRAGLHAPFAASAIGSRDDYFRRFIVIRKDSKAMKKIIPLVYAEVVGMRDNLAKEMKNNADLQNRAAPFMNRLNAINSMSMVPGVGTAPFYIVVTEKKGFPPVELQSLAHCLENMWLKATALDLGFQIVSVTAQMAENARFCSILGIEKGSWALMGCAIGYPAETLSPSIRPSVREVTSWLE
jgi:nitroreductase